MPVAHNFNLYEKPLFLRPWHTTLTFAKSYYFCTRGTQVLIPCNTNSTFAKSHYFGSRGTQLQLVHTDIFSMPVAHKFNLSCHKPVIPLVTFLSPLA